MVEYRILGPLEVASEGQRVDLGPPKQRALLAVLLAHANEIVPTDRLIDLMWGEKAPRTAAHSIQVYISDLRKRLEPLAGAEVIVTRPPGYLLRSDPDAIDAHRFERLVTEGIRQIEAGEPSAGATTLRGALELWRGPPFADFPYEEFAQPEIHRLQELRLGAIEELASTELESGQVKDALVLVEAAVAEDPPRERPRELQMLALYRAGRHVEALRSFQIYRESLADELGLDPSPGLQQLQERILLHDPSLVPPGTRLAAGARNPYKGLRAFVEDDAGDFFGREALVGVLLDALEGGGRLLALVGPSGSGKSSVVAAGLLPRLRQGAIDGSQGWQIAWMVPGGRPLATLEATMGQLPSDGPSLLVVDQFEEAFSMAEGQETAGFLRALAGALSHPEDRLRVILTLRADAYDRPLLHPEFARPFAAGVVNVLPMTAQELEEVIVGPARRAGVEVEPALLAELVAVTADQPGALPLLEYALTELFDRREGTELTLGGYRALGGLFGLVSRRSEALYEDLDEEHRRVCLQVFLRLVRPVEDTRDSRRRTALRELTAVGLDPVALSDVLEAFGRHRLLTFDRDPSTGEATIELAHEALLREWGRLAGWIDRHRDDLRRHGSLAAAAREWEASGKDPDYLLAGSRLADYEEWGRGTDLQLAAREREFLDASLERRRTDEEEEALRRETQRRLERASRSRLADVISEGRIAGPEVVARTPGVVLVWEGYGDAGWGDAVGEGFDRAVDELGLPAERRVIALESQDSLVSELRRLSEEGADLIVAGSAAEDLAGMEAVADQHPDCRYVGVDVEGDRPNITYVTLGEEGGAFLAGAAAALKSETGIVGFIGGQENRMIMRFSGGFEAGARAVRPGIDVRIVYLHFGTPFAGYLGFADPRKASGEAERLFGEGADVIHVAAGSSGFGVFDAAARCSKELGRQLWAIGVDTDQYRALPQLPDVPEEIAAAWRAHILTSVVKRYDVVLSAVLRDYARGALQGGTRSFRLSDGATELAYGGGFIDDIRPELEELRHRIVEGEIMVPTRPRGA